MLHAGNNNDFLDNPLLFILVLAVTGIAVLFILSPRDFAYYLRPVALFWTVLPAYITYSLCLGFDVSYFNFQYCATLPWIGGFSENFHGTRITAFLGIDGISLFFIALTTLLVPICLLASWELPNKEFRLYAVLFFTMEFFLVLVFAVQDILLFYVFFEAVLIPMFLIIGIWGGSRERKIKAAYYFFLYTLLGSVLMLLGILALYTELQGTSGQCLYNLDISPEREKFIWLSFFIALAVKIPMFPTHIWLPEAHVEAPTGGSVMLAGVLLKMGGYGFIRFLIPVFPETTKFFTPMVQTLAIAGIVYASFTTLRQVDLKRIVAYSSVAHMNFVILGIFSLNDYGLSGAIFLMLGHGVVSSALFLLVGVLYSRSHSRLMRYYGGVAQIMPLFAIFFLLFTMANMALPGTCNFVGEFYIFLSLVQVSSLSAIISGVSVIFCAAYSVFLYNRVCFGSLKTHYNAVLGDMTLMEIFYIFPLAALTIFMGVFPEFFLERIAASSINL